jgi:hypothetical protein
MNCIQSGKEFFYMEQPISREQALRIVSRKKKIRIGSLRPAESLHYLPIFDPDYNFEDYWAFYAPWREEKDSLQRDMEIIRSSRVILVSKDRGEIFFDGSAHDEG